MDLKHQKYELNENIGEDELIRNLKVISEKLQTTLQEEETQEFIPLAFQLSEDYFLSHPSKDVQLLVACCIADILRIHAPEAPYKDQEQIKTIFMFLVRQLEGISNPRHKSFSRYFYLMEILAYTKSFTLCFELEDNQEVYIALFKLIFKICSIHEPNPKVKSFMLDIMCPLIAEADTVSNELLDVILRHIIEPEKTQNPNAYELCKQLITKTSEALSIYVKNFLCTELVQTYDRAYESTSTLNKIFDVMYELYVIAPKSVKISLPTLEGKLQSKEENSRMKALEMLIKILSEEFATEFPMLWQQFKQRFADIAPTIRRKCVQASKIFFSNETDFKSEIIQQLCARKRDSDESVRFEVVTTVVDLARKNWKSVVESDLIEILKERVMDTKFIVRKEALQGFSIIYKSHINEMFQNTDVIGEESEKINASMTMIKNKILHGYYMKTIEDKMLIERLLITCLIPYNLDTKTRMKVLYYLLCDIDEHAVKAFVELQRQQTKLRKAVFEWIKCHKKDEPNKVEITTRAYTIASNLPELNKSKELLLKFSGHMLKDIEVIQLTEAILSKDISCLKCTQKMQLLLKKTGNPSPSNFYYNTIKNLLNRIASVTVDRESIEEFLKIVETKIYGKEVVPLTILSQVFPPHFYNERILSEMLNLLKSEDKVEIDYKENIFKTFTNLSAYKTLDETFPHISDELMDICKRVASEGFPNQCKQAVKFMCVNTQEKYESANFEAVKNIVSSLETSINISNHHCRTAITAMGVICEHYGEYFQKEITKVIGRNIVRGLLLNSILEESESTQELWIEKEQLPENIRCIIAACKSTVNWLYGLKDDLMSAQKTFKIYDALIITDGNIQEKSKVNRNESAWIKLTAAKCILKICEHKVLQKGILPQQFLNLSKVMLDESTKFREHFLKKLQKGLNRTSTENSLPLEFLSLYVFGAIEREIHLLDLMRKNFNTILNMKTKILKVNDKDNDLSMKLNYLPLYAISLLTHSTILTDPNDLLELRKIEKCLKFIIDPLIDSLESTNNISCIKYLIGKIKQCKNKIEPENDMINIKMWTIAEIATKIMKYSSPINKNQECTYDDVELPDKFYEPQPEDFKNDKIYLSNEFLDNNFHSNFMFNVSRKRSSEDDFLQNGSDRKRQKELTV